MVIIDIESNTSLGGLTLDPAGMHCPLRDDAFVSSCFWIARQQCGGKLSSRKLSSEDCSCERPGLRRPDRVDICRLFLSVWPIYTILVEPVLFGFNQRIVILDCYLDLDLD